MEHLLSSSFHNRLKNFVIASKQYTYCRNESSSNSVLCSLQILGQSSNNQCVFDSNDLIIQEFYIHLYELMSNTDIESDLMWAAVNVLQSNVKQGYFCSSKLNNYKFTLILTKLLKDQLSFDRKIKILKLLQELTYGVKLQWQEGYLSELIVLLVKWISCEDKDLISYSLGVLLNVCCKNKFAMFTLVKYTNSKSFMRLLLKLQSDDIFIKILVYKLLLILEQVSGQVPHVDVNNLVDITFIVLGEGLKQKNVFILHHTIDFFVDISEHLHWKNSVLQYSDYKNKIVDILETINNVIDVVKSHNNNDITFQCIEIILKFVNHVIGIEIEDIVVLYPTIIVHILTWVQSSVLYQQTMSILQAVIINVRMYNNRLDQNLQHDIYDKLEESLNVLLIFLVECTNIENTFNTSSWDRCAVCLKILQEMLKLRTLYEKIEEKLNPSTLQSMFHSLISVDINNLNNLQNITCVYLEALCFLSNLVAKNPTWMSLYSEVLNEKHVYTVLAFIIYNGPKYMKQKVLDLITKFSQQSTLMLSDSLEEIELLSSTKVKNTNTNSIETDIKPLSSFAQEEQLQMYIDQLENIFSSNEIHNIKTSDVIKLYQHKVNVLKQTEVWLKQSLDKASTEITRSNYQINNLNCESMQLNQMLLENHQTIDEMTVENSQLKTKFDDVTEQLSAINNNFAQLSRNYESKRQIIQERDSIIINLEQQLENLRVANNQMKVDFLDQLENEKNENKIQISKLEQKLVDKQNIISEKTEEIDCKTSFIRNLENLLTEKEKEVVDLRNQLEEQHRIRAMISQMLAGTGPIKS